MQRLLETHPERLMNHRRRPAAQGRQGEEHTFASSGYSRLIKGTLPEDGKILREAGCDAPQADQGSTRTRLNSVLEEG